MEIFNPQFLQQCQHAIDTLLKFISNVSSQDSQILVSISINQYNFSSIQNSFNILFNPQQYQDLLYNNPTFPYNLDQHSVRSFSSSFDSSNYLYDITIVFDIDESVQDSHLRQQINDSTLLDNGIYLSDVHSLFYNLILFYRQQIDTKYLDFTGLLYLFKLLYSKNSETMNIQGMFQALSAAPTSNNIHNSHGVIQQYQFQSTPTNYLSPFLQLLDQQIHDKVLNSEIDRFIEEFFLINHIFNIYQQLQKNIYLSINNQPLDIRLSSSNHFHMDELVISYLLHQTSFDFIVDQFYFDLWSKTFIKPQHK